MNNFVKITSGVYRGRKISTPGGKTHPMGERERLALFNMISEYLPDASVLDAFAGSGALGIEALSRGANEATFVEKDTKACRVIQENLRELGIAPRQAEVKRGDAYTILATATHQWKVVLVDPPYDGFDRVRIENLSDVVMGQGGILVLSHPGEAPEIPGLVLQKSRQYAGATISLYVKN